MNYEFKKRLKQNIAFWLLRLFTYSILIILFVILGFIVKNGIGVISWDFLTEMPKEGMTKGGYILL